MAETLAFSPGQCVADCALSLVGTRFRLHGRSVHTGLDCVGVAVAALAMAGCTASVPADYRMRGESLHLFDRWALASGLVLVPLRGLARGGDIILCQLGLQQCHVLVDTGALLVHAHAGLRRVVAIPRPAPWPVLRRWRWQAEG